MTVFANTRLSIVVPAYNVEDYISEALESILAQSVLPHEIVIIDDGSTDFTAERLAKFLPHPLFRVHRTANRGLGEARNFGLRLSKGEYVYFLDADDRVAPKFVENIYAAIARHEQPDLILFSGESFLDPKCKSAYFPNYRRKIEGVFSNDQSALRALVSSGSLFSSACLYVSKRALWFDNGLAFKNIVHEDEEIIFPLIASASITVVTKATYFYRRIREGSIMTSGPSVRTVEGHWAIVESLVNHLAQEGAHGMRDRDLWIERMRTFLFSYAYLAREFGVRVNVRTVLRALVVLKEPRAFAAMAARMLPRRLEDGIRAVWPRRAQ